MTKQEHLQLAVSELGHALAKLNAVKRQLLYIKNDQHIPLAVKLAELEEIHEILSDPECTPEWYAVGGSE